MGILIHYIIIHVEWPFNNKYIQIQIVNPIALEVCNTSYIELAFNLALSYNIMYTVIFSKPSVAQTEHSHYIPQ